MNKIIHTKNAPQAIGPYSQAIASGGFLFISGQIALNPETGILNIKTIEIETHQVMKNLEAILFSAGLNFSYVVKSSIFLKNMDDFSVVNEIYGNYFKNKIFPARETLAVTALPKNVNVEISMIAKM